MYAVGSEVYIYHNSQLITAHTVAECKLNYTENGFEPLITEVTRFLGTGSY